MTANTFNVLHGSASQTHATQASQAKTDPRLARLRKVTGEIVGSVFYGTLLRSLRSSAFKGKYGHGGYGETVFQGQLDQVLAERAGGARSSGLSEALLMRLAPQQLRIEERGAKPTRE